MDEFNCRRDPSNQGQLQRQAFDNLLTTLEKHRIPTDTVRDEIVKFLHGKPDALIALLNTDPE